MGVRRRAVRRGEMPSALGRRTFSASISNWRASARSNSWACWTVTGSKRTRLPGGRCTSLGMSTVAMVPIFA